MPEGGGRRREGASRQGVITFPAIEEDTVNCVEVEGERGRVMEMPIWLERHFRQPNSLQLLFTSRRSRAPPAL